MAPPPLKNKFKIFRYGKTSQLPINRDIIFANATPLVGKRQAIITGLSDYPLGNS
jgi:hypothetical protein